MLLYLNEYNVASAVYTFISNIDYDWVECIRKTQINYKVMRQKALDHTDPSYLDLHKDNEDECAVLNMHQMMDDEIPTDQQSIRRRESIGLVDKDLQPFRRCEGIGLMDRDQSFTRHDSVASVERSLNNRMLTYSHSFDHISDINVDRR